MARRLSSSHCISVSGTPLKNNSLDDILPLCAFLNIAPFNADPIVWRTIFSPRKDLKISLSAHTAWAVSLMTPIMIRRTKKAVERQCGLKPKVVQLRLLKFTEFESKIYGEKEESVRELARSLDEGESDTSMWDVRAGLDTLRRGCCHPQLLGR